MSAPFSASRLGASLRLPTTPRSVRLSAFVLVTYSVSLLPVAVPGIAVVRGVLGFVLLSFVPGYLILESVTDEFRPVDYLYAVGFSVSLSMFVGWGLNALSLRVLPDVRPFEQPTLSVLYVGLFGALTGVVWYAGDRTPRRHTLRAYDPRTLCLLVTVPVLAVAGALLINRAGFNGLTLLTVFLVALVPVGVYRYDETGRYYPVAIAAVSLALVLQNTVILTYLGRGDGLIEYQIARNVVQNGYWVPGGGKAAMPRIGVLHPLYTLVLDTSLLWEFKLVHPLLFSMVPVVTYAITARYFSRDVAFLSATLYIFLPRTYQLLGRNTRTGSAILFTALLLLVLLDDDFPQPYRSLLALAFFWGVIASHYGIGPLVLFALLFAYPLNAVASRLLRRKRASVLPFPRVVLYAVLTVVWYLYLTNGTFEFVVGVLYNSVSGEVFLTSSSTASRSLSFRMPSLSYQVMLYGHLLVGVLTSLGLGVVYLRYVAHGLPFGERLERWLNRSVCAGLSGRALSDSNYIHLVAGIYLLFPLSFGPQILSAGRTFGLVMMLLAPFPILLLRSTRYPRVGSRPALASLFVLLVVTSGLLSATVTHDVSPQPTIDGDRIVASGSTLERFSYYRVATHRNSIEATNFMLAHLPADATVHKTALGTFLQQLYEGSRASPIGFTQLNAQESRNAKYVYLSEPDTVTGTNTYGYQGFTYYAYRPLPAFHTTSTVYTTGVDELHYNADGR